MADQINPSRKRLFSWLERFTASVLLLVILSVGWMVLAEDLPAWLRFDLETEVLVVIFFLCLALGLVSGLSLLHTRSGKNPE